jgi:hypothetical protein
MKEPKPREAGYIEETWHDEEQEVDFKVSPEES